MGHKAKTVSVDATNNFDNGSSGGAASSAFAQLSFAEVLEDLSSRFIVNLPAEELASIERICFQVEQAHWFYEDFLRPLNPSLNSFSLRRFSSYLLHTSALTVPLIQRYISTSSSGKLNQQDLEAAFDEFLRYKTRVPVCGVVMLNLHLDKCVLVKGWKSNSAWGFPKGKINQQESERDCAVREVLEETGYDCGPLLDRESSDFMELTMREQKIRLYIVPGVDEATHFETLTRKEISKIAWFKLSDLPTWKKNKAPPQGMGGKFYLISPFIGKLKQWIQENKSQKETVAGSYIPAGPMETAPPEADHDEPNSSMGADDLKALLGLGNSAAKGPQMIQEQGDARSRQLLDLLRGDSIQFNTQKVAAAPVSSSSLPPANMDERERGTAALLAALNAGAGRASQLPSTFDSNCASTLLSMLNDSAVPQSTSQRIPPSALPVDHVHRRSPPLPAPRAQNTAQAQNLLKLISPNGPNLTLRGGMEDVDKEREREAQRTALLTGLMASTTINDTSPVSNGDQKRASDFRFPTNLPPPPMQYSQVGPADSAQNQHNLLALLQPPSHQQAAPPPLTPSPFSTFVQQASQTSVTPSDQHSLVGRQEHRGDLLALLSSPPPPPPQYQSPPHMLQLPPPPPLPHQATPLHPPYPSSYQQGPLPAGPPMQQGGFHTLHEPQQSLHQHRDMQHGTAAHQPYSLPSSAFSPNLLHLLHSGQPPPPPAFHSPNASSLQNTQAMDALARLLPS